MGGGRATLATIGKGPWYTLDRHPVWSRPKRETDNQSHSHSQQENMSFVTVISTTTQLKRLLLYLDCFLEVPFMLPTRKHFLSHNGPQACRDSKHQLYPSKLSLSLKSHNFDTTEVQMQMNKQVSRGAQGDDLEDDSIWHVGFHSHNLSSFICSYYDVRQHWKLHKRHSSKFLKQFA